jgi:hypothetical protein
MAQSIRPRWAPRTPQAKIRWLYELDAQGITDEELIADVGYRLYSRCQSILAVTRIWITKEVPFVGRPELVERQAIALLHKS